jgi:hypothetical protein
LLNSGACGEAGRLFRLKGFCEGQEELPVRVPNSVPDLLFDVANGLDLGPSRDHLGFASI